MTVDVEDDGSTDVAGAVVVWAETAAAAIAVVAMKLAFIVKMKFLLLKIKYMDEQT